MVQIGVLSFRLAREARPVATRLYERFAADIVKRVACYCVCSEVEALFPIARNATRE
jgi:hypothetical protein